MGVSLETLEGARIFDSVSADEMKRYFSFKAGVTYLAQVEFPGEVLLNAGSFRLSVNVVSNYIYLDKQKTPWSKWESSHRSWEGTITRLCW